MAVNLLSKYAKQIDEAYTRQSVVTGHFAQQIDFVGVRTVQILSPQTVPVNDYKREGDNRYGTPTEMQDVIQELTLSQDKSFALTIDKGNNKDQGGLKAAGRMLALQVREQCVPEMDRYMLDTIAHKAGVIVGNGSALTSKTIVERIATGTAELDDREVPEEGRTLFISAQHYKTLRLSEPFIQIEKLGYKSVAKGVVGEFDGMPVVKVPKSRWPKGLNFMIAHKNAATVSKKISETHLHVDPPGISGNLLEGRYYYDAFVMGQKANGIYVDAKTPEVTVTALPSINPAGGEITSSDDVWYTTDKSDPRYSKSAIKGKNPSPTEAGMIVKAYAQSAADGAYPSAVVEKELES